MAQRVGLRSIGAAIGAIALSGCSVLGIRSGYEQPDYAVVERLGDGIEIRRYGPRLVAEAEVEKAGTDSPESAAFEILAGYIFGANRAAARIEMTAPVAVAPGGEKIAMTAPVAAGDGAGGRLAMRFYLPRELTAQAAPVPTDPRVRVREIPGETVATLRFSGSRQAAAVAPVQERLLKALAGSPWRSRGTPYAFFYDPPWTLPFLRRNEAAVAVDPS